MFILEFFFKEKLHKNTVLRNKYVFLHRNKETV